MSVIHPARADLQVFLTIAKCAHIRLRSPGTRAGLKNATNFAAYPDA
ncbi:hypothetical protein CHISP_1808 [Chitinispirillum alkaliphilum]|nr:hypothetical protein CHISP_1808 [Chitinispirillum alkaliphilum]